MKTASCAFPVALAWLAFSPNLFAQADALPPIFAPRQPPPALARELPFHVSPTSLRLRAAITERILANATVFNAPAEVQTIPELFPTSSTGDVVQLDAMVVRSTPFRVVRMPPPDPPLLKFINRGTVYSSVGRKIESEMLLNFLPVENRGYGGNKETTRVELRFNFRW